MNRIKWIITFLSIVLLVTPGYSLVVRSGQSIEVAENEIIDDDLIVFAKTVNITGKVTGDLWAFAQNVYLCGEVGGSIFSGAASVDIDVKKVKTVWAAGGNIKVSGLVEKNVILFGGTLLLDNNATVGKDLGVYGSELNVKGKVGGTIKGGIGDFVMEGQSGDVDIKADEVKIKSGANITGDLIVRSKKEPVIEEGAKITGETRLERKEDEEEKFFLALAPFFAFMITIAKIIMFIAKIIVGIIIIALFKKYTRRIMDTLIKAPWKSLGLGFLGIIVIPVVVVILFCILIGYPLAIFGIYVLTILCYLSSVFVGLVIGEKIIQLFKKPARSSRCFSSSSTTRMCILLN